MPTTCKAASSNSQRRRTLPASFNDTMVLTRNQTAVLVAAPTTGETGENGPAREQMLANKRFLETFLIHKNKTAEKAPGQ